MNHLTPEQLQKLEKQIRLICFKLAKVCKEHQIPERYSQLRKEGFDDWDALTQEGMVNALHNANHLLDRVLYWILVVSETEIEK